ncbi:MAG TPA: hypothetical protein VFQ80_13950, partial [Thermomicrobiales bacterium]|nr:hypothetical protein [Thermomicrobiales bacterium]
MFAPIGRRLALLNAAVVVAVIALVGATMFALLRQSLNAEADRALAERAESAKDAWEDRFARDGTIAGATPTVPAPSASAAEHPTEDRAEIESGNILLFAVAPDGAILAASSEKRVPGLPEPTAIAAALAGEKDTRTVPLLGERVRVYTEPVERDGRIVGAVQAAQSDREHEAELGIVARASLAGIGLGALAAVPIGLFLARRAMRPI